MTESSRLSSLIFCVIYISPVLGDNQFYSINSTVSIATNIAKMFEYTEPINTASETETNFYQQRLGNFMMGIVNQIAYFEHPRVELNYLYETFPNDTEIMRQNETALLKLRVIIDQKYEEFKTLAKLVAGNNENPPIVPATMIRLTDHRHALQLAEEIHKLVLSDNPWGGEAMLPQISIKTKLIRCHANEPSPQQYIMFMMYLTLVSYQLKTFAITVAAHLHQFSINKTMSHEHLKNEIATDLKMVKNHLRFDYGVMKRWVGLSKKPIKKCSAKTLKRDDNFIEFERVFQLAVVPHNVFIQKDQCARNSVDMESHSSGGEYYCNICQGLIRDCQGGPNIDVCVAKENRSRRYEWIQTYHKDGFFFNAPRDIKSYGKLTPCQPEKLLSIKKWFSFEEKREYRVCTCEENTHHSKDSTFIISSQHMKADVTENMVVTGLRFVKKDRIVYTQIKQGKLKPGGWIDQGTDDWKPIKPLIREKVDKKLMDHVESKNKTMYKGFIVISNKTNYVNLDSLSCPSNGYIVTGVVLRMSKKKVNAGRIVLAIRCHLIDFKNWVIMPFNNSGFIESSLAHQNRLKIGGLPPDRVQTIHRPILLDDQFIEIKISDSKLDAGQSVLPWLDAQMVTMSPSVPISGIGLHHITASESGGFLAYHLFHFDYSYFF